jgi:citrate synthase
MMFATPREEYTPNPVLVRAVDRMLTLHADCGQDAATATVRMAGSSGANPYACLSAAIACLSGKALGGTSEACLAILAGIGDAARASGIVALARELRDGARLPGFGNGLCGRNDPRLPLMRQTCAEVLQEQGLEQGRFGKLVRQSRGSPSRTVYWSTGICSRTRTSTAQSYSMRSAFRRRCSPAPWPWRGVQAGWRTGKRC